LELDIEKLTAEADVQAGAMMHMFGYFPPSHFLAPYRQEPLKALKSYIDDFEQMLKGFMQDT
jgi:hypothetical protein